jgi:hypothetical protein
MSGSSPTLRKHTILAIAETQKRPIHIQHQKKSKTHLFQFIFFLRTDEHLKVTTLRDPKIMWLPVAGLRPLRSPLSFTQNLPNPLIKTSSPDSSVALTISTKVSTSFMDLSLEYPQWLCML